MLRLTLAALDSYNPMGPPRGGPSFNRGSALQSLYRRRKHAGPYPPLGAPAFLAYHLSMDSDQFHRISKALADPQRLAILERIAAGPEVACAALCDQFPVAQATISHHVKELVNAGLVKVRRQAKFVFYQLQAKVWAAYLAEMQRRIPAGVRRKR